MEDVLGDVEARLVKEVSKGGLALTIIASWVEKG